MQIIFVKRSEIPQKNFKKVKKLRQVHEIKLCNHKKKKTIIINTNQNELQVHKGAFPQRAKATLCNTIKDKKKMSAAWKSDTWRGQARFFQIINTHTFPLAGFQIICPFKTQTI